MKRLTLLGGIVAAGSLAATALAALHADAYPRVTINSIPSGPVTTGDRVLVHGRLVDKATVCVRGKTITLYSERPGKDARLGSDLTDGEGEYRFVLHPRARHRVYARFAGVFVATYGGGVSCHSDNSRRILIAVR